MVLPLLKGISDWRKYLSVNEKEMFLKQIRKCTAIGCPAGSESFVIKLEDLSGRTLKLKPVGRPKKNE